MAKTSAIQKNLKRIKMVKKFAKKRAALKKIINNKKLELSERFEAQLKLNKLPKNSAKIRGMDITIVTTSINRKGTLELLKEFNFPLTSKKQR